MEGQVTPAEAIGRARQARPRPPGRERPRVHASRSPEVLGLVEALRDVIRIGAAEDTEGHKGRAIRRLIGQIHERLKAEAEAEARGDA